MSTKTGLDVVIQSLVSQVRQRMWRLGISQQELATRMGCSQPNISTLLHSARTGRTLNMRTVARIAEALDMKLSIKLVQK